MEPVLAAVTIARTALSTREALEVAKARVAQALENVYQARVALGLPDQPLQGKTRPQPNE